MLLHEESDQIVLENSVEMVSNSCNVEEDLRDLVSLGREIAQCLQEREKLYPYPSDFTLENLSALILEKLSYFLDAIFAKSTTSTGQEKINLQKVTIAHVIMQWCKKEGYQSPLLLAFSLFVHQITRSCVLVDVLYALGLLLPYSAMLDFEKCASVSTVEFTDAPSEEQSMECFLQLIADNFEHNEDTTTGSCTTHVMGLISSQYPKSNALLTQQIMKQTITSKKMTDLENVRDFVKMYKKPSISKLKKTFVKGCDPSQLGTRLYDILQTFLLLSSSFMKKPPNWQRFLADIIHRTPLPLQIQFRPVYFT